MELEILSLDLRAVLGADSLQKFVSHLHYNIKTIADSLLSIVPLFILLLGSCMAVSNWYEVLAEPIAQQHLVLSNHAQHGCTLVLLGLLDLLFDGFTLLIPLSPSLRLLLLLWNTILSCWLLIIARRRFIILILLCFIGWGIILLGFLSSIILLALSLRNGLF